MSDQVIEIIAKAIDATLLAETGSGMSERLCRIAARGVLKALDGAGATVWDINGLINGDLRTCDGYCNEDRS